MTPDGNSGQDAKQLLSPKEFAEASGFSLPTIRRYLEKGKLPKFQPAGEGGRIGIPRSALQVTPSDGSSAVDSTDSAVIAPRDLPLTPADGSSAVDLTDF